MNSDAFDHWENGFPFDIYNYTSLGLSWRFGLKNNKPPPYQYEEQDNYFEEIEVDTAQNEAGVAGEDELGIVEIGGAEPVQPPADSSINETTVVDETPVVVQTEPAEPQKPLKPNPEYRIQIRAKFGKPLSREQLSAQYGIPVNEIMEDRHNGYYIYTIGSYATYDEAKERRNKLRNVNGIYDAFVVAFNECGRMDKLP
jgi:cell division protein FtsN